MEIIILGFSLGFTPLACYTNIILLIIIIDYLISNRMVVAIIMVDRSRTSTTVSADSDLSLSICSVLSAGTDLQKDDTLPVCDLEMLETSEDVTLPEAILEEQLEGATDSKLSNCESPPRSPLHSSTPMKRTVRTAKRKAKASHNSQFQQNYVADEVAENRQKDPKANATSFTDATAMPTRYEGDSSYQHNNNSDHDEVLSEQKWQLTSILKMNGCSQNCATKVHMINEYDILIAHSQFSSKSIQEQSLWIIQYFDTHCPSSSNGEKDIKKMSFYIQGRVVCLPIWLQILAISTSRFYRIRNDYLTNGGISYLSKPHRAQLPKTMEAIAWMTQYFARIGDKRPDKDGIYLPTCLTEKKIYEIMCDELQLCHSDVHSQCISYSKFCQLYTNEFKNVSIPKVSYNSF